MGFSFFRLPSHNVFDYKPRFYDPEKEERREKLNELRISQGKEPLYDNAEEEYKPGSLIKGNFRPKMKRRSYRDRNRTLRLILITIFLLFMAYIILIADFSSLVKLFMK
ncbi:MAG: hypothetical protein WHW07_10355 [Bacteroidales bacterium]|jgi:hypothetical protein|nr:hypothetical protein [Bacteroidales bacterium]HOL97268.1 hypothetical protein [Bacteroidales bacterium]HOM35560.1 hypothetical protein [Bacteroidales bacterium]HPD24440.1 hypothetical protein [Bacteroidales bacterium]HRS98743.1 hypothetical protein [Bacteroidales bacterium]